MPLKDNFLFSPPEAIEFPDLHHTDIVEGQTTPDTKRIQKTTTTNHWMYWSGSQWCPSQVIMMWRRRGTSPAKVWSLRRKEPGQLQFPDRSLAPEQQPHGEPKHHDHGRGDGRRHQGVMEQFEVHSWQGKFCLIVRHTLRCAFCVACKLILTTASFLSRRLKLLWIFRNKNTNKLRWMIYFQNCCYHALAFLLCN